MILDDYLKQEGTSRYQLSKKLGVAASVFQRPAKAEHVEDITMHVINLIAVGLDKTPEQVTSGLGAFERGEVDADDRSTSFGKLLGYLEATAIFAKNDALLQQIQQATPQFVQAPATTYAQLYGQVAAVTFPFPLDEQIQVVMLEMDDAGFNDQPLAPNYMMGLAKAMATSRAAGEHVVPAPTMSELDALGKGE